MWRLLTFCSLLYFIASCSDGKRRGNSEALENPVSIPSVERSLPVSGLSGKELSLAHCSGCHAYVKPDRLPKTAWKDDVLPAMGHRLGIYQDGRRPDSLFDAGVSGTIVRKANIYPESALLAEADWKKIVEFYIDNAPDSVAPPVRRKKIRPLLRHFEYKESSFSHRPPLTTMVKILSDKRGIVFSDGRARRNILTFLTPDLRESYSIPLLSTAVQFTERSNDVHLTTIGKGVRPNDAPEGAIQRLHRNWPEPKYKTGAPVLRDLQRPVYATYGDVDGDGFEDVVLCEYGNRTGKLSLYLGDGNGGYTKRILRDRPGAITAIIKDANKDGLPDIYALMAQGDEGVFLYENQGGGRFQERRLLSFSPLHGSQYMELADFNGDGFDDIVYVCGDNADLTPILKEYHGIYIFLGDGKLSYTQAYFYQMNGAYKAMARDYDLDGDLDLAAISFFPDYKRYPEESFIYLANRGNLTFDDYSFPQSSRGRWMVMDAADMDSDGDVDLALGSFVYFIPDGDTTGLGKKWLSSSPSVIILENTIR